MTLVTTHVRCRYHVCCAILRPWPTHRCPDAHMAVCGRRTLPSSPPLPLQSLPHTEIRHTHDESPSFPAWRVELEWKTHCLASPGAVKARLHMYHSGALEAPLRDMCAARQEPFLGQFCVGSSRDGPAVCVFFLSAERHFVPRCTSAHTPLDNRHRLALSPDPRASLINRYIRTIDRIHSANAYTTRPVTSTLLASGQLSVSHARPLQALSIDLHAADTIISSSPKHA